MLFYDEYSSMSTFYDEYNEYSFKSTMLETSYIPTLQYL